MTTKNLKPKIGIRDSSKKFTSYSHNSIRKISCLPKKGVKEFSFPIFTWHFPILKSSTTYLIWRLTTLLHLPLQAAFLLAPLVQRQIASHFLHSSNYQPNRVSLYIWLIMEMWKQVEMVLGYQSVSTGYLLPGVGLNSKVKNKVYAESVSIS